MKILASISLSILILVSSVSGAINLHYCAGQVVSISILPSYGPCCCSPDKSTDKCCHDELVIIEDVPQDQVIQYAETFKDIQISNPLIDSTKEEIRISVATHGLLKPYEYPPPLDQPIWLVNCQLVVYG